MYRCPQSPIPLKRLRAHLAELPRDRPVFACCRSGFRSHLVSGLPAQHGCDARKLSGGDFTFKAVRRGSRKGVWRAQVIAHAEDEMVGT